MARLFRPSYISRSVFDCIREVRINQTENTDQTPEFEHEILVNAETGNMGTSRNFSDFPGDLNGSTQHLFAVYLREFQNPRSFAGVDLNAGLPCPVRIVHIRTGRSFWGSIVAAAGWCFRSCRAARDCGDHRSRLSHRWPH